jgi:hypothetical protein
MRVVPRLASREHHITLVTRPIKFILDMLVDTLPRVSCGAAEQQGSVRNLRVNGPDLAQTSSSSEPAHCGPKLFISTVGFFLCTILNAGGLKN